MRKKSIVTFSLDNLEAMIDRGEVKHSQDALEGAHRDYEDLSPDFWSKAVIHNYSVKPRSVHLKIDPEVFDFFIEETGGKGHITRMQEVLKSYMRARTDGL